MFRPANWSVLIPVLCVLFGSISVPIQAQDTTAWTPPGWVIEPDNLEKFRREKALPKSFADLRAPNPSTAQKDFAKRVVHYHMSHLLTESQNHPKEVIDRFLQEFASTSPAVWDAMLAEVAQRVPELLDHPNPEVRVNAINLLNHCSVSKPGTGVNPTPPKPYVPAMDVLIPIASNQSQPWEVRNLAVVGLARILRDGEPGTNQRSTIAAALVPLLLDAKGEMFWYRWRIVEALGYSGSATLVSGAPAALEALMAVLSDKTEDFRVRSEAALAISRLNWTAGVNEPLIMEKVGELVEQIGTAQAQSKSPNSQFWTVCMVRIYVAFRPQYADDAKVRKWGFLYKANNVPASTAALWKAVFPITLPFLTQSAPGPIAPNRLDDLKKVIATPVQPRTVHTSGKVMY